jgi:hypothetical protein
MCAIVRFDAAASWALPTFCRAAFDYLAVAIVASGLRRLLVISGYCQEGQPSNPSQPGG